MKNDDPFTHWIKADAFQYNLNLHYLSYTKIVSEEENTRLLEMLKSKDPESVELAKITIKNLIKKDEGKRTNVGE